jgi:hemolysin activation/secretion protein
VRLRKVAEARKLAELKGAIAAAESPEERAKLQDRASREADKQAKREAARLAKERGAAEKARRVANTRARRAAEAKAEALARTQREAAEEARDQAEALRAAAQRAQRDAEKQVAAKAKKDARKRAAAERAKRDAEEQAARDVAAQAKAQAKAERVAERARKEAVEAAQAEAAAKVAAAERARREAEKQAEREVAEKSKAQAAAKVADARKAREAAELVERQAVAKKKADAKAERAAAAKVKAVAKAKRDVEVAERRRVEAEAKAARAAEANRQQAEANRERDATKALDSSEKAYAAAQKNLGRSAAKLLEQERDVQELKTAADTAKAEVSARSRLVELAKDDDSHRAALKLLGRVEKKSTRATAALQTARGKASIYQTAVNDRRSAVAAAKTSFDSAQRAYAPYATVRAQEKASEARLRAQQDAADKLADAERRSKVNARRQAKEAEKIATIEVKAKQRAERRMEAQQRAAQKKAKRLKVEAEKAQTRAARQATYAAERAAERAAADAQELRDLGSAHVADDITTFSGRWPPEPAPAKIHARAETAVGSKYDIGLVAVTGDRDPVEQLVNWDDYVNDAMYSPMSEADIESFRQRVLKDLQDDGYVFATVSVYKPSLKLGFLKLRVHVGDTGEITITGNKWHTAENILKSAGWVTGNKFNYKDLYSDLFGLNVRVDLEIDTKLKPKVDAFGRRVVDVEFVVEDSYPLHLALNFSNAGTEETGDWRTRTTLQHLDVTGRNDTLTVDWLTDPFTFDTVNAINASYYTPWGPDKGLTIHAGWSESDFNDLFPLLDVFGEGYHIGMQLSKVLKSTKDYNLDITGGWTYRYVENSTDVNGVASDRRDITISTPSMTLGYSAKNYDQYGGRNFASVTLKGNFAGKFGSSNTEAFFDQNPDASGDYWIYGMHLARFQKFFEGEQAPGKWSMYMELDVQAADDALVSAVQYRLGGADSVRGYEEGEIAGDTGFRGQVELRTPLIDNFIPGLKKSEDYLKQHPDHWSMHRLQFIGFTDFGRVETATHQPGDFASQNMLSVGLGLRMGLTKYSQIRFDYGYPIEETDETAKGSGKPHLQLQVQF